MKNKIEKIVKKIIKKNKELNEKTTFDSLELVRLIVEIEKNYNFKIKTSEYTKLTSYKNLLKFLKKKNVI